MKKIAILVLVVLLTGNLFSQKVGYVHTDSVYRSMPEMKEAQTVLNDYLQQVQAEIESMQKEYQEKVQIFNENVNTYSEVVKNNKITEIQDLEKRIQDFQLKAQTEYLDKQKELILPIEEKFDNAIEKVRLRLKYDVVMNISTDVLYVDPKFIITGEVLKELGIVK